MAKELIKLTCDTGFAGGKHLDFIALPDGWESWDEKQRQSFLSEEAQQHMENSIEYGAYVVDVEKDEDYEPGYYSA